jgi:hypothetical protein
MAQRLFMSVILHSQPFCGDVFLDILRKKILNVENGISLNNAPA